MYRVIAAMTVVAAGTIYGGVKLYDKLPVPVATAVIAEKPGKTMGGTAAVLLPTNLSNKQATLLQLADTVARDEGISPEMFKVILLQETRAGAMASYKVANVGPNAYYGPMQIKLAATRDVLQRNPSLYKKYNFHTTSDDEVKANLILNEKFNMVVAAKYLKILQKEYGLTGTKLTNAYNRGPGGVQYVDDNFHYAREGKEKLARYKRDGKV